MMKIYKVGEVDWVIAESAECALRFMNDQGLVEPGYEMSEVSEVTESDMDRLIVTDEEMQDSGVLDVKRTFRDGLAERIAEGKPFPQHFCSSEW